ncbi:MAG: 4Fe-4S binding protein [Rhodospirillales bacterium]|nr:4Fe-4S binding protein [Rhodospirillales bacterium]
MEMKNLALIIDHYACFGCLACEVACKQENGSDYGVKLIEMREDGPRMMNGKLDFTYIVNACLHAECEGTPCVDSCPDDTITVRPDGIVVMNEKTCTGCEACIPECPTDAIRINDNDMVTEKCNLCYHRVDKGLMPACADNVCLSHCIYFGEVDDIKKQIAAVEVKRTRGAA